MGYPNSSVVPNGTAPNASNYYAPGTRPGSNMDNRSANDSGPSPIPNQG